MWDMIINEQLTPNAHLGLNEKWGDQRLFNQKDRHRKAWLFLCGQTWLFSLNENQDLQILRFLNGKKEYVNNSTFIHFLRWCKRQLQETMVFTGRYGGFYKASSPPSSNLRGLHSSLCYETWIQVVCPCSRGRFGKYHQQAKKQVRKIPKGIWYPLVN